MDFSAECLVSLNAEICNTLRYWKKPGYNSSRSWGWRLSSMATSFPGYSRRSCERWAGKYTGNEVTLDGSWSIHSTVSLKQAAQLMLQLNQGSWDVIYKCGCYFHPIKQKPVFENNKLAMAIGLSGVQFREYSNDKPNITLELYDTKSYYQLIVSITKCENLSFRIFINVKERFLSKNMIGYNCGWYYRNVETWPHDERPHFSRNFTAHYACRNADLNLIRVAQR